MTMLAHILAQRDDGIGELLYLALFLTVSAILAISNWIKKKAEEKQVAERQRRMAEQAREETEDEEDLTWETFGHQEQYEEAEPEPEPENEDEEYYFRPPAPPPMPASEQRKPTKVAAGRAATLKPVEDHHLVHAEVTMPSAIHDDPYAISTTAGQAGVHALSGPGSMLDLSDPERLREAIVLRELLGPPLAMRQQPASWEV